jgi:uncharacterized membrane protein
MAEMSNSNPSNIQGLALRRLYVAGVVGAVAFVVAWLAEAPWSAGVLIGWSAAMLVFLTWVWVMIGPLDAKKTARLALAEDDSRAAADATLIGASIASLIAVGLTLHDASKASGAHALLLTILAVLSIALGWAAIHTTFTLRYAKLYYEPPVGGIDFESEPDYRDLAYMAFTVGMTYQVSDTQISRREIRHTVIRHALVSFVFGTSIIAVTINVLANFLNK